MHDFLLAKQIFSAVLAELKEYDTATVTRVDLEIGSVSLAHDDLPEHVDDVSVENLRFALEAIAKGTVLEKANWQIEKIEGNEWKIQGISVE